MRVCSRIALLFVFVFAAPILLADHFRAECPMSLVDSTPPTTDFDISPHFTFRNGNLVHVLRGNIMTTYTVNDVGDLQIAREDFVGSLAGRETDAGVAFGNGFLYISSEAGLEVFDMRNVRAGGNAPILVTRRAGAHYRRLAVNGTRLAGLYPSEDLPCYPDVPISSIDPCFTTIDIYNITTPGSPTFLSSINSRASTDYVAFNDIAFNFGFLVVLTDTSLIAFNVSGATPSQITFPLNTRGKKWLVTNGSDFLGAGNDTVIETYRIDPVGFVFFNITKLLTIPFYLQLDRTNQIRFHPKAFYDETNARLITLIEEADPMTLDPARTIAFDVFDFTVPQFEGSVERVYEDVTMTVQDEIKYNPLAAGAFVYVIGEESGLQEWGACHRATGRIELDSIAYLTCGGSEIHGWVTGTQKIVNVELFLDNTSLGAATVGGPQRTNVSSTTPVFNWRINVNLDSTARGEHLLRAIATDSLGQRRQFAFKRIFFGGPGTNCTVPRRRSVR